jgi:sugar phosphate isomerase/epimerase
MRSLAGRLDLCAINTATLGHKAPIEHVIDDVARSGFGGICPWRRDLVDYDVVRAARRIRDAGLKVTGFCRSTYLPAITDDEFRANLDDNRRAIDQAATLEAECFVMVVGSLPAGSRDLLQARTQVAVGVATLCEYARRAGVRLALEPLHPMYAGDRSCVNTIAQALDIADAIEPTPVGTPTLGVAVDVYHVWWDPNLGGELARAGAANRLFAFHVCDWLVPTRDLLTDRGMMGDGVIDIRSTRRAVEGAGYRGLVEVEIFSEMNWWRKTTAATLATCSERLQSIC